MVQMKLINKQRVNKMSNDKKDEWNRKYILKAQELVDKLLGATPSQETFVDKDQLIKSDFIIEDEPKLFSEDKVELDE